MAETYSVDNGTVALVANTAKTVIELAASATASARLIQLFISSDPTTAGTLKVELIKATTGTGTAYTPAKMNGEAQNRAALCTAKINDTVEPTAVTVLATKLFVLPLAGFFIQYPLGREWYLPPSAMIGVRLTSSITANALCNLQFEE